MDGMQRERVGCSTVYAPVLEVRAPAGAKPSQGEREDYARGIEAEPAVLNSSRRSQITAGDQVEAAR